MEIVILIISGIIGGLIAGLLGLGGGIFYILILPYAMQWYGIPIQNASAFIVANSFIGIVFASATSLLSEFKNLKQYWKESLYIAFPAVLASLLITRYFVHSDYFSIEIFNFLVIILMIFIIVQLRLKKNYIVTNKKLKFIPSFLSGLGSGILSALSGLGGGIIIIPLLQIKFKQAVKKAKLISLVVIFLSSAFISIQNLLSNVNDIESVSYQQGYIMPGIAIPLIIGVFIGSPIGVKLSRIINDEYLNLIFVLFASLILIEKLSLFL